MPYRNIPSNKQNAMEACVRSIKAAGTVKKPRQKGQTIEQAIHAICYETVMGSRKTK